MKGKRLFLGIFLIIVSVFFCSCSKGSEKQNNQTELIKGFFQSDVSVVSKDGKLSFILSNEKITVTSNGLLKNAVIYEENGELKAEILGYKIPLPKSYISSLYSLFSVSKEIKEKDLKELIEKTDKNGKMSFQNATIELKEEEILFSTGEKDFIIKRTEKENDKDKSRG